MILGHFLPIMYGQIAIIASLNKMGYFIRIIFKEFHRVSVLYVHVYIIMLE